MAKNEFSELKYLDVNRLRKVQHTASNYVTSIDRTSFGFSGSTKEKVQGVAVKSYDAAETVLGVTTTLAGGTAVASAAFAASGVAAVLAGPASAVAGVALMVVGFARAAYSNREAAHKELIQYTWSLVDDEGPDIALGPENIERAASSAQYLLDEGGNQLKLLQSKFDKRTNNLRAFSSKLDGLLSSLKILEGSNQPANKAVEKQRAALRGKIRAEWASALKADGAIFEYVRRCVHTGNYLQSPAILALGMRESFRQGLSDHFTQFAITDYFQGTQIRKSTRDLFDKLSVLSQAVAAI